jgi:hypothetical protein
MYSETASVLDELPPAVNRSPFGGQQSMNQLAFGKAPEDRNSGCAELSNMAGRELAAFCKAVTELFGPEQAELSAEEWLLELNKIEHLPASAREWRSLTARASAALANRVNVPVTIN